MSKPSLAFNFVLDYYLVTFIHYVGPEAGSTACSKGAIFLWLFSWEMFLEKGLR